MNITELAMSQIFVFGSNTEGRHGAGAAKQAMGWGAIYGRSSGLQGRTYAIPTKRLPKSFLGWDEIGESLLGLFRLAASRPDLEFLLTPIGTGLAGGKLSDLEILLDSVWVPPNVKRCW